MGISSPVAVRTAGVRKSWWASLVFGIPSSLFQPPFDTKGKHQLVQCAYLASGRFEPDGLLVDYPVGDECEASAC
jgi:hypothetical protein